MNKDTIIILVKLFVGMVAISVGGTLMRKAGEDAGKLKLNSYRANA